MPVGEAVPMLDAVERVTGAVPYAANLKLPGMLAGKVLRSPAPHARLVSLDVTAAESLPGVVAVVTAADFDDPGLNLRFGPGRDQPVLARDRVRYIGEPVALVAAETLRIAEEALKLIEVEYEDWPAVFDVAGALAAGAPTVHADNPNNRLMHARLRHGDLEAGFARADEIVAETYTSPLAQSASLEPQVAAAQWQDGQLTIWTSTQSPYSVRHELAGIFGLPPHSVRVIVPPLGGGFGGKGNIRTQPLAAALARKAGGRPVKLVLSRAEEFVTVTKHAVTIHIKSGVTGAGLLTARQITLEWNVGAYTSSSYHLVPAGMLRAIGPYKIPAVSVDSHGIYTNLPPAAAFRGAMSSQGVWAHESHMDTLAHRLGMDPLELRLKNLLRTGDHFATGETIHEAFFGPCLLAAAKGIGWEQPLNRQVPAAPHLRRGRGLGVMMKNTIATSRSECRLSLSAEGRVTLYTSAVEMGQGAHTALAQVCAHALGLPLASINVYGPDTAHTPFDSQTASSRTMFMMGRAVIDGAAALKARLCELAGPLLERPVEALSAGGGYVTAADEPGQPVAWAEILGRHQLETLEAEGAHRTQGGLDPETGQGLATPHWHQGAGACEVEVDLETGKVKVLRYYATAHAGQVINPALARLQNDGNVIFGLGPALMEEMFVDGGQVVNANLSDYLIPSILDLPLKLESASLEAEGGDVHGLGEMTLPPVAPAIGNAIFDAMGVRLRSLPLSAEKLLRAYMKTAQSASSDADAGGDAEL